MTKKTKNCIVLAVHDLENNAKNPVLVMSYIRKGKELGQGWVNIIPVEQKNNSSVAVRVDNLNWSTVRSQSVKFSVSDEWLNLLKTKYNADLTDFQEPDVTALIMRVS